MSEKPTIGFIGVGFMGHGMASNILKNGYPLMIKGNQNRAPIDLSLIHISEPTRPY